MTPDQIKELAAQLAVPFYQDAAFWIGTVIGLAGVAFSALAFFEAKQAKRAAVEAGRVVKIETVKIELADIAQRLDKIDPSMDFPAVRDLLNEVNRKLRRQLAPFQRIKRYSVPCVALQQAFEEARAALDTVKPADPAADIAAIVVYNVMEGPLWTISSLVGEILGLFEAATIESPNEQRNEQSG